MIKWRPSGWYRLSRIFLFEYTYPMSQAETLKYLYLLFEDENVIPLDGELLVNHFSVA